MDKRYAHIYVITPKEHYVETFDILDSIKNVAMMIFISSSMKIKDLVVDYEVSVSDFPSKKFNEEKKIFE